MNKVFKLNFLNQLMGFSSKDLELNSNQIIYTTKYLWLFSHEFKLPWGLGWLADILRGECKILNIPKIIYFDSSITVFGTKISTGYKAGGGDDSNIDFTFNKKEDVLFLKQHILERGGVIGANDLKGEKIKSLFPLFNPKRWLSYREIIIISEEGIGHTNKSWFKTRNSFLPYESINMYCYNGVLNKDILLLGDTTISLVEKLSNTNNDKLKKILHEKGVTSTKGRKYLPALLSFKRGLSPDVLITTEKGILFKSKKLIGGQTNIFLGYDEINKFEKHGWYKLFAPVFIEGRRVDARKGEGGNVNIMIEGVAFYRWCTLLFFNGSLKSTLKSKSR
jgi:hypothetical protein